MGDEVSWNNWSAQTEQDKGNCTCIKQSENTNAWSKFENSQILLFEIQELWIFSLAYLIFLLRKLHTL